MMREKLLAEEAAAVLRGSFCGGCVYFHPAAQRYALRHGLEAQEGFCAARVGCRCEGSPRRKFYEEVCERYEEAWRP